jgi:hypothetical protein
MTRPPEDVEAVRDLLAQNLSIAEVARRSCIPRGTIRSWLANGLDETLRTRSAGEEGPCEFYYYVRNLSESSYAYLLGLYLGDGCISEHQRGVFRLRIFQDQKYPSLIHQCMIAMRWVLPNKVGLVQGEGCKEIYSYSKHWPCVFPQHGVGPKFTRSIVLEPWQRWVAIERHPHLLVRGLMHSDGCRTVNRVVTRGKPYEYVRYMFKNRSDDIHQVLGDACDRLGVEWRRSYKWTTSISKRSSVERLDRFVGPKA